MRITQWMGYKDVISILSIFWQSTNFGQVTNADIHSKFRDVQYQNAD